MNRRSFLSALVLGLLTALDCPGVRAETGSKADKAVLAAIDAAVRAGMEEEDVPGVALAVVKDGKLFTANGWGFADVEKKTPVKPETVFRIASISKQFLAAGMLALAEEGKLKLEDPVSKHLEDAPEAWEDITIRHLLSHTGGLVREAPGYMPLLRRKDIDVIRSAYQLPLVFEPGEKYQYSNVGYFTIAEIMHRASGKPWADFMQERIFKRAGLNATCTTDQAPRGQRALGYEGKAGKWSPVRDAIAVRPSGAFFSTVLDLAKWDMLLDTDTVLKPASRAEWFKPVALNSGKSAGYALGWTVGKWKGKPVIRHNGSQTGFRTAYLRLPGEHLTVIVLTNHDDADADGLVELVAGLLLDGAAEKR